MRPLLKSFSYAWSGLLHCLRYERNMRIHLVTVVYMYSLLLFFRDFFVVSKVELTIIFIANALVFISELINTAIEATINLLENNYNKMAKIAKDTAAAAVLTGAFFAFAIGIVVLWQPDAFKKMYAYYLDNPWMLAVLALSLAGALIYIFAGPVAIGRFFKRKKGGLDKPQPPEEIDRYD